jgi:NADH-quinone oxidoreductase subunit H
MSDVLANVGTFVGTLIFGTTLGKMVLITLLFAMPLASVLTWMERRQSAYLQDRVGPQRAHFLTLFGRPVALLGLLHIAADGLKMFFKENVIPNDADRGVFRIAPLIGFAVALITLALIPFGPDFTVGSESFIMQVARIDSGILLVFAMTSLGIYGAALAGWASNNRFALLGSLRASAQSISYEIALGLTVVGILIAYGSTELSAIVRAQGGATFGGVLPNWGIFLQPIGGLLFFTAAMAETKRVPFDLPEGESEIVGYFLEYSSMSFGLFMLGEFLEVVVLACVFTTLFLGGWQLPWFIGEHDVSFLFWTTNNPWVYGLVGMAVFGLKVFLVCAFQLQIRWTLPRFRYDQLMRLGWKNLLPVALFNIAATAALVWWDPTLRLLLYFGIGSLGLLALITLAGPRRGGAAAPAHGGHAAAHSAGH